MKLTTIILLIFLSGRAAIDALRYYDSCGVEWYKCKGLEPPE